jgi:hypothetical protein
MRTFVLVPVPGAACDWTVTSTKGSVRVRHDGGGKTLRRGDAVVPGDTVTTGRKAKVALRSGGGDAVRPEPGGRLQLADARCGSGRERRFTWRLGSGRSLATAGRLSGRGFVVEGSGWAARASGATFWVDARGRGRKAVFRVRAVKGAVELRSLRSSRRRVIVRAGRCASGRGNGSGRPTRPRRCRSVTQALATGLGDPVEALRH